MKSDLEHSLDFSMSTSYRTFEREENLRNATALEKDDDVTPLIKRDGTQIASKSRQCLVLAVCVFMNMSGFGLSTSMGIIYVELIDVFQCPRSQAALTQSLYSGLVLGGALLTSRFVLKFDTGKCIFIASFVSFIGFSVNMFVSSIYGVIVSVGVISGISSSVFAFSSYVVASWIYVGNKQFAVATVTLGIGISSIIMPYTTDSLLKTYAWNEALLILGSLFYLNCIPCGLLIYYSRKYLKSSSSKSKSGLFGFLLVSIRKITFILPLSCLFFSPMFGSLGRWFVVDITKEYGYSLDQGTFLLSLFGIFNTVCRILSILYLLFFPETNIPLKFSIFYLLFALGTFLTIVSSELWCIALGMSLHGLVLGCAATFRGALNIYIAGYENYPHLVVISNCCTGIGQILGGFLGGLSFDLTGSYHVIFYVGCCAYLVNSLSMLILYFLLK